MNEKNTDDIFALCSRFDLDQDNYHVFPKRAQLVSAPVPREVISIPEAPQIVQPLPEPTAERPEPQVQDPSPRLAAEGRAMRADLRNLLRNLGVSAGFERPREFEDLLTTSIFVHAAAGGVGATTIVATLARLLGKEDKHCVVVDGRPSSLMPFFLGGRPVSLEAKGLPDTRTSAASSAIRIVTRDPHRADQPSDDSPDQVWYRRNIVQLKGPIDHILVDALPQSSSAYEPYSNHGVSLIVARPDANSLVGSLALKHQLTQDAPDSAVICVLNKFDSSLPLHVDMAHWFEETFQTVKIRRSDVVNEALTEGLTVIDWAPAADVAADFAHLLSVIESKLVSRSKCPEEQGSKSCR